LSIWNGIQQVFDALKIHKVHLPTKEMLSSPSNSLFPTRLPNMNSDIREEIAKETSQDLLKPLPTAVLIGQARSSNEWRALDGQISDKMI
jgi:hypothetical protein